MDQGERLFTKFGFENKDGQGAGKRQNARLKARVELLDEQGGCKRAKVTSRCMLAEIQR